MAQKGTEAKAGPKLEEWGEEQTLDALRRLDEMRSKVCFARVWCRAVPRMGMIVGRVRRVNCG